MDIYAYHLEHPELSQFKVALLFNVHKNSVWLAYRAMSQSIS